MSASSTCCLLTWENLCHLGAFSCSGCSQHCSLMACSRQAPRSTGVSRQQHCSGLPCPPPGDPADPGVRATSVFLHRSQVLYHWATKEALVRTVLTIITYKLKISVEDTLKVCFHEKLDLRGNLLSLQWSEPRLIIMEACTQASERMRWGGSLMGEGQTQSITLKRRSCLLSVTG